MNQRTKSRDRIDYKIMFMLIFLVSFGLVMIYSIASARDNMGLFKKQVIGLVIGFVLVFIFHRCRWVISFARNKVLIIMSYVASYVLILLLMPHSPLAYSANGATRWIKLGPVTLQVADIVKIAVILTISWWIEYCYYRQGVGEEVIFVIGAWVIAGIPTVLILYLSKDLSSAMVIAGIAFIMTFVASRGRTGWILHLLAIAVVVVGAIVAVWYVSKHMPTEQQLISGDVSYRIGRVAAWLDPEQYADTVGYQPLHCFNAIANGGLFGKGLGQSWQKAIMPECENDVIFAIVIEELGIVGGCILLVLFGILFYYIMKVSGEIPSTFRRMMTLGIGVHLMLQVVIHCSVCINLIPNTGIGLPFISSGMTAGLLQMAEIMLVLSTTRMVVFNIPEPRKYRSDLQSRLKTQKYMIGRKARGMELLPKKPKKISRPAVFEKKQEAQSNKQSFDTRPTQENSSRSRLTLPESDFSRRKYTGSSASSARKYGSSSASSTRKYSGRTFSTGKYMGSSSTYSRKYSGSSTSSRRRYSGSSTSSMRKYSGSSTSSTRKYSSSSTSSMRKYGRTDNVSYLKDYDFGSSSGKSRVGRTSSKKYIADKYRNKRGSDRDHRG